MSIEHVKAVVDSPNEIEGGRFKVLVALAEWANADGTCWYSIGEIARRAHRSTRATIYILQELEALGYITIQRGHGRGNASHYTVQIDALNRQQEGQEKVQLARQKVQTTGRKSATTSAPITEEKVQLGSRNGAIVVAAFSPENVQNGEIKGAIQDMEKVQFNEQKVQFEEEKVQLSSGKGAISIAHEPLLINHQYNHQENHQDVNHQDSGASVLRRATDPPPTEVEVEPEPAAVGVVAESAAKPTRKPREKAEQKPKAPRHRKQTKHEWPEDFNVAYLWRLLEQEFGKLTWSTADWSRETAAANVVANAGIEEGVSEHDILAFLKYLAACDRRWKANGAEMPLLSRNHAQFGAWWAAGKPEQPNANTNGGYANGNGTRNGAERYGGDRNARTNRALEWNARFAAGVRATGGDSQEFPGGRSDTP